MNKGLLIPRMALQSIRQNSATYLPYIGVSIFAMFTYFVFGLILNNDVMTTIPKAVYAQMLMMIGFFLLAIIMVPFLFYTNSFLIKRRKRELGLYSILGMEKKHIGMMLLVETAAIYVIVEAAAVGLGLLFSRLLFLLLLNLAKLPARGEFAFSGKALSDTLVFFGIISLMNLVTNLWQVGRANPIDLMGDSRKGEKEPKAVWIWSLLGAAALVTGYRIAVRAQVNSMIFIDFFLAVFLVVAGTYFLFTSGTIVVLRIMKRRKQFYYRPANFVTVSGMLYRMKKNAASLSNICIFATMVMITAVCTVSLYLGTDKITHYMYPYLVEVNFMEAGISVSDRESLLSETEKLARQNNVSVENLRYYSYVECPVGKVGNAFVASESVENYADRLRLKLFTLEEFNRLEQEEYTLEDGEVLLFCGGPDFLDRTVKLMDREYTIKEELQECVLGTKIKESAFYDDSVIVFPDERSVFEAAALYGMDGAASSSFRVEMTPEALSDSGNVQGAKESVAAFAQQLEQLSAATPGFAAFRYYAEQIDNQVSMYGGLLFIGIFFALIFLICLLVIMYYKQITEGYEDQSSFEIMQKVGMSDREVKSTIRKQILLVFFLPLIGAFCHTAVGMNMVMMLMGTINLFDRGLFVGSALGVSAVFALVYIFCYRNTARTYYKIVRWR